MCETVEDIFLNNQLLISDENTIVSDMLKGYVKCNPELALLDFGNVIIRRDYLLMDKVKILTGCPSGHEPSYAGFVGKGFLTATVQGDIYCPPPPEAILQTIKELSRRNMHGILIILGDSLSNRINFSLAIEKASKIPNFKVKTIFVEDEKRGSLTNHSSVGTILLQKIAGAMAEIGFFLGEIYEFCESILRHISTISVVIETPTYPWAKINTAIQPITGKIMMFGAGNHGQPGYLKMPLKSTEETVRIMLEQIRFSSSMEQIDVEKTQTKVEKKPKNKNKNKNKNKSKSKKSKEKQKEPAEQENILETPVVVIINNLGNTSKCEEQNFIQEVLLQLQRSRLKVAKILIGTFMTSLRMSGFTITVMNLSNPKVLEYISYPCNNKIWQEFTPIDPDVELFISTKFLPHELRPRPDRGPELNIKEENIIKTAILFACEAVTVNETYLNDLDREHSTVKTGSHLKRIAAYILNTVYAMKNLNYPYEVFRGFANQILKNNSNRPTILCLYCIILQKASNVFFYKLKDDVVDSRVWLDVLKNCASVVQRYGKDKIDGNTMYDPLFACATQFETFLNIGMDGLDAFKMGIQAAESDVHLRQNVDPAAYAVTIWLRAVHNGIIHCMKEN